MYTLFTVKKINEQYQVINQLTQARVGVYHKLEQAIEHAARLNQRLQDNFKHLNKEL